MRLEVSDSSPRLIPLPRTPHPHLRTMIMGDVLATVLSFNHVVTVGAGTCGCVIASRLSEDRTTTVLVLEAGGDDLEWNEIAKPGSSGLMQSSKYDWSFRGVSQENAFKGFENQVRKAPLDSQFSVINIVSLNTGYYTVIIRTMV